MQPKLRRRLRGLVVTDARRKLKTSALYLAALVAMSAGRSVGSNDVDNNNYDNQLECKCRLMRLLERTNVGCFLQPAK